MLRKEVYLLIKHKRNIKGENNMPKIVIREFDNTTAADAAYANFAVVVPGFYSADKDADKAAAEKAKTGKYAFDENGVFECRTRKEFEDKIGLTSSIKHLVAAAKAPTYAEGWTAPEELTEERFNELVKEGNLYRAEEDPSTKVGEYQDEVYKYQKATEEEKSSYEFLKIAGGEEEGAEGAEATSTEPLTLFVQLADVGHDDIEENHMGNQIAWELLGLGYTVLYKKLDSVTYLENKEFWEPLKDKTLYDFRYIMSGLLAGNQAIYQNMVDIAKFELETNKLLEDRPFDEVEPLTNGRGDCIALLDIDEEAYKGWSQAEATKRVLAFVKAKVPATKYAAAFVPAVTYSVVDKETVFGNKTFPASFHYLACAARSSENFNEWYANAGYTRGISKYTITSVGCKFGEAAVNMFQKRAKDSAGNIIMAINPIIQLRGSYYLWGNRTTEALGDKENDTNADLKASHFLNIRQLCCTLKKQVYVACRQFTFDPNSDALWINFCNSIKPILEKMKADQGIADYKIIKVKDTRKAFLSAIVRIVPIEAVEDFDISIHLEDSLGGMIATAEE